MRKTKSAGWSAGKRNEVIELRKQKKAYFSYLYSPENQKVGLLLALKGENGDISYGYSLVHYQKKDHFQPDTAFAIALARCESRGVLRKLEKGTKKNSAIDAYESEAQNFVNRASEHLNK